MSGQDTLHDDLHGLTVEEFVDLYSRGVVSLDNAADFSIAPDGLLPRGLDPRSHEYGAAVLDLWSRITGRERYRPEIDEAFALEGTDFLARPFPYSSDDLREVGRYFGAIAGLMRRVPLPPGSRVVEYGSGWGHLALMLASAGMHVTAVDLNEASVDLLRRRAAATAVPLEVVRSTFLAADVAGPVDAIVFFESFHHCHRPLDLLDRCTASLAPGGRLIFAADAIYDRFHDPWSLRLDGTALWFARRWGWLELGFDRSFLYRELLARGFDVDDWVDADLGAYGGGVVATRRVGAEMAPGATRLPPDEDATWGPRVTTLRGRLSGSRSCVTLPDASGTVRAVVTLRNHCDVALRSSLRVDDGPSRDVELQPGERTVVQVVVPPGRSPRRLWTIGDVGPCAAAGSTPVGVYVESIRLR